MRQVKRVFRPGFWPSIATLLLLPVLISLGFWQLDRAEEKREIQTRVEQRTRAASLHIGASLEPAEQVRYRNATVSGTYDARYQLLIDNKFHNGRVGYQVITPLQISGSDTWVLVNRGWVPQGSDRQSLPDVRPPAGTVTVRGLIEIPHGHVFAMGDDNRTNSGWPAVVLWLDLARYARETGYRLQPFEILQDPADTGGYERQWTLVVMPPEKSVSYAVQWFAMAVALVVIYIVVNLRRVEDEDGRASGNERNDVAGKA